MGTEHMGQMGYPVPQGGGMPMEHQSLGMGEQGHSQHTGEMGDAGMGYGQGGMKAGLHPDLVPGQRTGGIDVLGDHGMLTVPASADAGGAAPARMASRDRKLREERHACTVPIACYSATDEACVGQTDAWPESVYCHRGVYSYLASTATVLKLSPFNIPYCRGFTNKHELLLPCTFPLPTWTECTTVSFGHQGPLLFEGSWWAESLRCLQYSAVLSEDGTGNFPVPIIFTLIIFPVGR